jgi:cytosine/adenosine deaminase-related metal-dependent hydrolase
MRAYDAAGIRARVAAGISTQSQIVHGAGEDEHFLRSLPVNVRRSARQMLPAGDQLTEDEYLDLIREIQLEYKGHPRLALWFGPPGPQWVSDEFMQAMAEKAEKWGMGMQTHGVESIYEMMHGGRFYGKPTILHLNDLGVLNSRFSIAHGVWLTEPEIEILAQSGASVVHNPSSNLRLRAGIAPLNGLLEAGVNVALGKDGTTLNDDEDMFTEMRMATRLHRSPAIEDPAPSTQTIFGLTIRGGAKLLRKERQLGRIAKGHVADLVLVSLDRITWPWVAPEVDPRDLMLYRAKATDVDTVLIGGEVVLQGGMPTGFDVDALGEELADRLRDQPFPQGDADLVSDMTPYLEDWYAQWEIPTLEPWIRYNTRR